MSSLGEDDLEVQEEDEAEERLQEEEYRQQRGYDGGRSERCAHSYFDGEHRRGYGNHGCAGGHGGR